mmetsp:Transcript_16355/g.25638  ORF Transcript_16355/g.25638 Transcript_16355/m.25638 type:complete len:206 (+) Transcript_16355:2-619(+)
MTPSPSSSASSSSNDGGTGRTTTTTTIEENNNNNAAATVSEPWTRIFPEKFGIRQSIEDSSFRWCVRESMMWGVATGAMMGVHRLRMKSNPFFVINVAFGTALLVAAPSYYFCYRRREHQEQVIEMMMAVNDFRPGEEMPESVPLDENHPFLNVRDKVLDGRDNDGNDGDLQKEFVARLKAKKDWQEPHRTQDLEEVFKEVKKKG